MSNIKQCNCEEMSCKVGCTRNHTHKGFACELCRPKETVRTWFNREIIKTRDFIRRLLK